MSLGQYIPEEAHLAGKRAILYETIQEEPGIHFNAIRRNTGMAGGTMSYHLAVLESLGYVQSRYAGPYRRFAPATLHDFGEPLDTSLGGDDCG